MSRVIPLARPDITDAEIRAVTAVLKTPQISLGPRLGAFESAFAEYTGTREAVACSSGTAALHLVMEALGVGPGDEVVTTPFSFVASTTCILMVGATPVFADIDPDTWNIDPDQTAAAVTDKTRAILAVDIFGLPAEMEELRLITDRHGLKLIEDSCEALGSRYRGQRAGSLGDVGVFAFYPNKQITTGEGGMIVTNDELAAGTCRSLRNHGRDGRDGWLEHSRLGYNYRLSDLNCALGIAQLSRIDSLIAARTQVRRWYEERLRDEARVRWQVVPDGVETSWFVFVIRLADDYNRDDRDKVLAGLRSKGIECGNYFTPIHGQPFMVERFGNRDGMLPVCEALAARTIALPFHTALTEQDVDEVCRALRSLL